MDRTGTSHQAYEYDVTAEGGGDEVEDLSITSEDHSFLYGDQPMASSTPRASKTAGKSKSGQGQQGHPRYSDQSSVTSENDHSFANQRHPDGGHEDEDYSIGSIHASGHVQIDDAPSPFEHLDRRLREELVLDDDHVGRNDYEGNDGEGQADETITGRRGDEGDAYDEEPSVILRPSRGKTATRSEATPRKRAGHAGRNEIGSPGWNGLTDLRTTPLNVKVKRDLPASSLKFALNPPRAGQSAKLPTQQYASTAGGRPSDLTSDSMESSDFGVTNMSPPVTTNFGNTITRRNIEKTPAKEAVRLVIDDLMRGIGGGFSPSPVMEADAAFAKYGFGASGLEVAVGNGTPSKSMGKRGQLLSQVSKRAMDRQQRDIPNVSLGDITARLGSDMRHDVDPDASTVGMPRGYRQDARNSSNTQDARSFLEQSFASEAGGNDSLEIEQGMQLPEGYDDPTILLGGQPYDPNTSQNFAPSPSPAEPRLQRAHYPHRDLLDAETTVDADTYLGGNTNRDDPHTATLNTMMTTNSDLLRFSPASSDAASVFGGQRQRGPQSRSGGFALLGADDIHTFHGGVSLFAGNGLSDA
jgi:hypothetical protein